MNYMGNLRGIVIDPGHGGVDSGAIGNDLLEKEYNLLISEYMYDRFRELGVPVYLTRDSDVTLNPSDRVNKVLSFLGSNIKLGFIPQEIIFDDSNLSILEEARKYFIGHEEHLRSALYKFLFIGENVHKKIKYLSGGEKVRLKLFCLIQDSYNFLILDEPTNHIDMDTREILENALIEFNGTILFVSHDRYFINKISNKIIEIKNKKIDKYIGNYEDYINKNSEIK